jgi:hypothetical protein
VLIDVALKDQCAAQGERATKHVASVQIEPVELVATRRGKRLQEHAIKVRRVSEARIGALTIEVEVTARAKTQPRVGVVVDERQTR